MQTSPTTYDPTAIYRYKDMYKVHRGDLWDVIRVTKHLLHNPIGTFSTEDLADQLIKLIKEESC